MEKHPHFLWSDLFRDNKKRSDLIKNLEKNVLFKTLNRWELKYLSHFVYERHFQANEEVFHQGGRGIGMYLIVSGKVDIRTQSGNGEVFVTELGEGSFFGELALVDPQHLRSARAVTTEISVLIGFFKPDLEEMLLRNPAMGVKVLYQLSSVLGRRLLETTQKMTRLKSTLEPPAEENRVIAA